jgi:parallel beta-helix repeat protein
MLMDMKRAVPLVLAFLLFSATLTSYTLGIAQTPHTVIYIKVDGSVEPSNVPIKLVGDVYTFTGDIDASIVVERNGTVIDGAGFSLRGTGADDHRPSKEVDLSQFFNLTTPPPPEDPNIPYVTPESNNTGIYSYAQNLTIRNLKIIEFWCAIELEYSSDNNIAGNIIVNNTQGIWIHYSSNNVISRNNISSNKEGITLMAAHDDITDNNITDNSEYGIKLEWSFNTISGNNITGNGYGVSIEGSSHNVFRNNSFTKNDQSFFNPNWQFPEYIQDMDNSNLAEGKPIYYWINKQDKAIPPDAGWVALVNCTHIEIKNLNLSAGQQILLAFTSSSNVTQNSITGNAVSLYLESSSNTTIADNTVTKSSCGIQLKDSYNNTLNRNDVANNEEGILLESSGDNNVRENNVTGNRIGLELAKSMFNRVSENNLTANDEGIKLSGTSTTYYNFRDGELTPIVEITSSLNNTFTKNSLTENNCGIQISMASNNTFSQNSFTNNTLQVKVKPPVANVTSVNGASQPRGEYAFANMWDNGEKGNYWGDYQAKYPDAEQSTTAGVWSTRYKIDENNADNYPLINTQSPEPSPWMWIVLAATATAITIAVLGYMAKRRRNQTA